MTVHVSVCIPVYGVEKYIERCARSLFEQTMTDGIEFIFVNDCTKDKSIEILEQVLSEYPHRMEQVKIIHHEKNEGLVAARNTGLKHATGDYIIHCDSDDWVDLNMYETMYNKAVETDADVVYCSFICEFSNKKKTYYYSEETASVTEYISKNFDSHISCIFTKLYKRLIALDKSLMCPEDICMGEDVLRNAQMLAKCKKIKCAPNVFYHYFKGNAQSISLKLSITHIRQLCAVANILENVHFDDLPDFHLLLKHNVLFQALKTSGLSANEYKKLFSLSTYKQVLQLKYTPFWKRFLLAIANISYPLANKLCLLLLKVKYRGCF